MIPVIHQFEYLFMLIFVNAVIWSFLPIPVVEHFLLLCFAVCSTRNSIVETSSYCEIPHCYILPLVLLEKVCIDLVLASK